MRRLCLRGVLNGTILLNCAAQREGFQVLMSGQHAQKGAVRIEIYIYMANENDTCSIDTMAAYEKSRGGTHFEVCDCLL